MVGTWSLPDKRRLLFELRLLELFDFFQVRREKGIPKKRAAIADEMEDLGVGYCDALRDGWVKYLSAAYPPGSKRL